MSAPRPRRYRELSVVRRPAKAGATRLGAATQPGDDYRLLVDGDDIGHTYWDPAAPQCRSWSSWGPAGTSTGHRTRQDAENAQVDARVRHLAHAEVASIHGGGVPVEQDEVAGIPLGLLVYDLLDMGIWREYGADLDPDAVLLALPRFLAEVLPERVSP